MGSGQSGQDVPTDPNRHMYGNVSLRSALASSLNVAAAYAPFGNGGTFRSPHFIQRIRDSAGRVLYQHRDEGRQVLSPQSAYLMTSLMQSVTAYGTGAKLSAAGTPVAGKTGTVNMTGGGNRDIWMAA